MTIATFQDTPPAGFVSYQAAVTQLIIQQASIEPNLEGLLASNAAQVFTDTGFNIPAENYEDFNEYFWNTNVSDVIARLKNGEKIEDLEGVGCIICKVGAYAVAIILAGIAAAAATFVTVTTPAIIALAAFTGAAAASCVAFVVAFMAAGVAGVTAIASEICTWTGAC